MHKGITLIETIIYLALYALLMTGALSAAYAIIGSSARNQTKALVQEEGSYLIAKAEWMLTGAASGSVTTVGGTQVSANKAGVGTLVYSVASGRVSLARGAAAAQSISNSNVTVTCPPQGCVVHTLGTATDPESVEVVLEIAANTSDGKSYAQEFRTTKYMRK